MEATSSLSKALEEYHKRVQITPEQREEALGVIVKGLLDDKDKEIEELQAHVFNMFGILRVLLPGDDKQMTDAKEFLKKSAPMMRKINEKIRHDAVDRVVAYLSGMGYVIDDKMKTELEEQSSRLRSDDDGNNQIRRNKKDLS